MNILLLGSGGREHTLAWKMSQSKILKNLFIMPGNAGTQLHGTNVDISFNDFEKVKKFVIENNIDMVVSGPEEPLVNGFSDFFANDKILYNIPVIGPKKIGAMLEGSKDFAKEFMFKHNIPTAKFKTFTKNNLPEGYSFLESLKPPYVLKADGLAAGKGVLIINNLEEAKTELKIMLSGKFGNASNKVVIEEFLKGIELSVFVITDGINYKILPEAKDYKRIGEGDKGLNTGGMGAVSPVSFADKNFMKKVEEQVIVPTIEGLKKEKIDYVGFIFFGLIKVDDNPYVIEYNARMGDPETEVVIPRINNDFVDILIKTSQKKLNEVKIDVNPDFCTTVMLVSKGYPGDYEKGKEIYNLDKIQEPMLFQAGTKIENGKTLTNGGRVIAVSAFGKTMVDALKKSYKYADIVDFYGKYYRKDIGFDL